HRQAHTAGRRRAVRLRSYHLDGYEAIIWTVSMQRASGRRTRKMLVDRWGDLLQMLETFVRGTLNSASCASKLYIFGGNEVRMLQSSRRPSPSMRHSTACRCTTSLKETFNRASLVRPL
ncbi:unnamed protein product, partial [Symbiodinium sp. CCMP2592]